MSFNNSGIVTEIQQLSEDYFTEDDRNNNHVNSKPLRCPIHMQTNYAIDNTR